MQSTSRLSENFAGRCRETGALLQWTNTAARHLPRRESVYNRLRDFVEDFCVSLFLPTHNPFACKVLCCCNSITPVFLPALSMKSCPYDEIKRPVVKLHACTVPLRAPWSLRAGLISCRPAPIFSGEWPWFALAA